MKTKLKTIHEIIVDPDVCKGCHLCIDQCPKDVLEVSKRRNSKGYLVPMVARIDDCITCMNCEMICPDLAITVVENMEGMENEK